MASLSGGLGRLGAAWPLRPPPGEHAAKTGNLHAYGITQHPHVLEHGRAPGRQWCAAQRAQPGGMSIQAAGIGQERVLVNGR